jgi:hypothetical protein
VNLTKAAGDRLVINDIANTLAACRRKASSDNAPEQDPEAKKRILEETSA